MEAHLLGGFDVPEGAFNQRRGTGITVLVEQILFETAGIDADADRDAFVLGLREHLLVAVLAAEVAGIDADFVDAAVEAAERHAVVVVDVADHRQRAAALDLREGREVFRLGDGDADDFAAGVGQRLDLGERGLGVAGVGGGHRLHPDGVVAADDFVAHADFAGAVALGGPGLHGVAVLRVRCFPPVS